MRTFVAGVIDVGITNPVLDERSDVSARDDSVVTKW
jgi:hypothetical protein